ncbi:TKL/TKL-ccin protein kinase [Mycena rebaudengoi]|nr:TKL/TKL-ccin protein kinase [Mycena rebaudengoi]
MDAARLQISDSPLPLTTLNERVGASSARLRLIPEFSPFLEYTKHSKRTGSTVTLLWETFVLGASLSVLLNLLGSPPPRDLHIDADKSDFGLALPHRERFFTNFIQRLQLLELQRRLPFGEVQDLFGGTNSGFTKVLKTVERVLRALQEEHPGLFVLPKDAQLRRREYIQELLDTERAHLAILRMTGDSAELLSEGTRPMDPCLECIIVNRPMLRRYHDQILRSLEHTAELPLKEDWDKIFSFEDDIRKNAVGAYRAICANYLGLADVLQGYLNAAEALLASHAQILLENVSVLLTRTSIYSSLLQNILAVTSPTECTTYDSLCAAVFHLQETSDNLQEMGQLLRTIRSARIFKGRAFTWRSDIDPSELGPLLLDDRLPVNAAGLHYSLFLFEMMLLCCTEDVDKRETEEEQYQYPVKAWELGPALQRTTPLNLVHAIPTPRFKLLRMTDSDILELDWIGEDGKVHTLELHTTLPEQYDQWHSALEVFAPSEFRPPSPNRGSLENDEQGALSEDEDAGGRRRSHPRPWSVIARKGPRSESSSLFHQEGCNSDHESFMSPNLLPRLFGGSQDVSPLAINTTFPRHLGTNEAVGSDVPPTPPPESELYVEADPAVLLDLTGQVRREGSYAQAHGGFADVWKGVWNRQPDRWVAVKVLRSRLDDPQVEAKMNKRLARELGVWKRLDHKHVLKLIGTVSDFGPYDSMVCPWLEQGSVSKYMERHGDLLSMTDRLQLLCEVADGLSYLHANSIVHGDLTGSNILIDDDGKAKLCDFGLSSIVVEFCGTASLTSCIGGAVRWADASLYTLSTEDDNEDADAERPAPAITTRSDIYSFGSVTLEILSGRVPYHYLRTDAQVVIEIHRGNKPRRPAESFVTDDQWALIQRCWAADPDARPDISEVNSAIQALHLQFRRHTVPASLEATAGGAQRGQRYSAY